MRVGIQSDTHQSPIEVDVVAGTGVQVMVAGTGHSKTLGIKVENLIEPSLSLKNASGGRLHILGSHPLSISYLDRYATVDVYFASGVKHIFLSLDACKELNIVHKNFPHVTPQAQCISMIHLTL